MNKKKKSIFRRWWFWVLIIIAIIVIFASINGTESNDTKNGTSNSNNKKEEKLNKNYKVGETVSYKGYQIKVNKVDYNEGSQFDTPDTDKQYVVVNITITNKTDKTQSYNPFDFKLNADGNKTDMAEITTSVKDTLSSGELDKGASVTGNLVGQAKKDTKKLKLQYQASIWNDETVDITLK